MPDEPLQHGLRLHGVVAVLEVDVVPGEAIAGAQGGPEAGCQTPAGLFCEIQSRTPDQEGSETDRGGDVLERVSKIRYRFVLVLVPRPSSLN